LLLDLPVRLAAPTGLALALLASTACSGSLSGGGGEGEHDGAPPAASPDAGAAEASCPLPAGSPQKQAFFTARYPDADQSIEDQLITLIQSTPDTGRIRVAVFSWTRTQVSDALLAAAARGVDVAVIVDEINQSEVPEGSGTWVYHKPILDLIEGLGQERVIVCDPEQPPQGRGGCHSDGINHNKFVLFSHLCDGSREVVFQSSANFTSVQRRLRNNMVLIRDDGALYAAYDQYWADMARRVPDPNYYRSLDGATGTKAYFYPRAPGAGGNPDPSTDTIHRILVDNVQCGPGSKIRVAHAMWTGARRYLVDSYKQAADRGCDVRLLVGHSVGAGVVADLKAAFGSRVRFVDGLHSKYFLVEGQYLGAERRLLWTGSHNLTGPALRDNDEVMLRIDDAAILEQFAADWQDMWDTLPDAVLD
jgi:phosphatidylserine/phosphatidylglycerophosphate/cardiolipin synthase-like enzyme